MRLNPGALLKGAIAVLFASGLAACREEEQNRPLTHTPGVYSGNIDEKLEDPVRKELRERVWLQGQ